jgi:hypothetical protein
MIKLCEIYELNELGINYLDDTSFIDYEKDEVDDLIRFTDKLSFRKDMYGNVVMVGIPVNHFDNRSKLINALKSNEGLVKEKIYLGELIYKNLKEHINIDDYDFIISPKSSSNLIKAFMFYLKVNHNTHPKYINDMFIKNDIENIKLDIEQAIADGKNSKFIKGLVKRFDMSKNLNNQSMKLQPLNNYERKYIKNMLVVNPEYNSIISEMIGKKVLVIDDILTSGKTINDMTNILKSLGVEDITLFCMFG